MTEKKLISVIIPVFNRDWCIEETIDSVLSQSYNNFELIVVNDGSFDNTGKILDQYESDKVKIINQKNQGVSAARNKGIKNAGGDYIAFLDSDDKWTPDKLELQMAFFEKNKDAVVCQTNEIWIRNGKRINPAKKHKKPDGDIFIASLSLCLVSPSAVMMKKKFFETAGLFDEKMKACEDYDLWLRSSLFFDFHIIEKDCVIKIGGHTDQLSAMPLLDKFRIYSLTKILLKHKPDKEKRDAALNKLVEKCDIYIKGCIKRKKWEDALVYSSIKNYWRKMI